MFKNEPKYGKLLANISDFDTYTKKINKMMSGEMFSDPIKMMAVFVSMTLIGGCSSIQPVGTLGPKKLGVYVISHNDFLSASRMMVVLDKKGNVSAYTGNAVAGLGAVALDAAGSFATAGAIVYGANAMQRGVQNANVKVRGVPEKVTIDTNINLNTKNLKF